MLAGGKGGDDQLAASREVIADGDSVEVDLLPDVIVRTMRQLNASGRFEGSSRCVVFFAGGDNVDARMLPGGFVQTHHVAVPKTEKCEADFIHVRALADMAALSSAAFTRSSM